MWIPQVLFLFTGQGVPAACPGIFSPQQEHLRQWAGCRAGMADSSPQTGTSRSPCQRFPLFFFSFPCSHSSGPVRSGQGFPRQGHGRRSAEPSHVFGLMAFAGQHLWRVRQRTAPVRPVTHDRAFFRGRVAPMRSVFRGTGRLPVASVSPCCLSKAKAAGPVRPLCPVGGLRGR